MTRKTLLLVLVILVAALMILSSLAYISPLTSQKHSTTAALPGSSVSAKQNTITPTPLTAQGSRILQELQAKGVPTKYIYMPSFRKAQVTNGNISGPSYTSSPAPMGIGTYGFSNTSGVISRYTLNTTSFEGSVTFNNFSTFYPLDDGPNSITVQLNSILSNVTLFGVRNYTFWNQNVLFFSARTNTVQFLDNIWNFSSPQFYLSPNVFSSYDGNLIAPYYYYAVGPAFSITYPFTVQFYLNTTTLNGDNTVFFNYTISDTSGTASGSFDEVQFNSTYGQSPGYAAQNASYLVTSTKVTPTGFIPYDSEIMIGGPGGGSTAMVYAINATMNLKYLDPTTGQPTRVYKNVPSAWDVGSETGETSTGISETWTPHAVAKLSAGPSFVYGMWNVSAVNTFQHYSGTVNPPNSFMFVSQGDNFSAAGATWSPLSTTGSYSFWIPTGLYSMSILMSNRDPYNGSMVPGSPQNIQLILDYSQGVYTPLYAFGNSQLQYISKFGSGGKCSPYILYNNPSPNGLLNPLFSTFNDYIFPEFSGVLLHSTSANVLMYRMPSFSVQYTQPFQLAALAYFGEQYTTNQIGYVLYDAKNVTLAFSKISGWFTNTLTEFPVANVLLWNSQNNLIVGNYFDTMDSSLLIYNEQGQMGNNSVLKNLFIQDRSLNLTSYYGISIDTTFGTSVYGPVAITVYSSGNTITGNSVIVYNPVNSPFYSIYSGYYATYNNDWNGNFWWNYVPPQGHSHCGHFGHYGHRSHYKNSGFYNNNGLIANGGDYDPIVLHHYNPAMFLGLVTNFLQN